MIRKNNKRIELKTPNNFKNSIGFSPISNLRSNNNTTAGTQTMDRERLKTTPLNCYNDKK